MPGRIPFLRSGVGLLRGTVLRTGSAALHIPYAAPAQWHATRSSVLPAQWGIKKTVICADDRCITKNEKELSLLH
ncbi:MAG TPA: hypothetical protein DHW15_11925 [Bacteroidetes bacterium]|nr:MAG: hypothetical protein ABR95_08715 [Sphingobacteriales bacterium BACL12 MAG-120813-bin55]HCK22831.1 hypothetical protein [Bacteroidota bacterium]